MAVIPLKRVTIITADELEDFVKEFRKNLDKIKLENPALYNELNSGDRTFKPI